MVARHARNISEARVLCLVGLFMLPGLNLRTFSGLAKEARGRGQLTVVDPGWDPEGWPVATVNDFQALARHTDVLLVNSDEAAALTGTLDHAEGARTLRSWGAGTVVIKRGGLGAYAGGEEVWCDAPALDVTVQDTVGAGDSFDAGFIAGRLGGGSLATTMPLATAVAGIYCSRSRNRFPSLAEARSSAASLKPLVGSVPTDLVQQNGAR